MEKAQTILEKAIIRFALAMLAVTLMIVVIAIFAPASKGEAPMGEYKYYGLNEDWQCIYNDADMGLIDLPASLDSQEGDTIILTNTLPDDLTDGMSLSFRSNMQDVIILVKVR